MSRSPFGARRRMAGVATAALLSLGLLTACGSESSDTDASSASSSQKSEKSEKNEKNDKGNSNLSSRAEGGETNFMQGDALSNSTFQFSVDGGTESLAEVTALNVDQPTEQVFPSNKLIPGQQSSGTVTVVRGAEQSQQFSDLVNGGTQPQTASLSVLDHTGAVKKQYTLQEPRVVKVDNPQTGNAQTVTLHFTSLSVG
ncbi:hypothetical protein [Streptomyces formicae]